MKTKKKKLADFQALLITCSQENKRWQYE